MSALRAGIYAYREGALIPKEGTEWNDRDSRLFRYNLYRAYRDNNAYREINTFSTQLKSSNDLYKHIRGVYSPVDRLVSIYAAKVYGGAIDFEDLSKGAIPITAASPRLIEALKQLYLWSNWPIQKSSYVSTGALLGDVGLWVIDEPDKEKVRLEITDPAKIKEAVVDSVGNVKAVTFEYERWDYATEKYYTYREVWGEDMQVATFKNNEPFAFYADANGSLVQAWENPYGFIPLAMVKHKDLGLKWGANAFHAQTHKIDELNDAASLLNDQVRKSINLIWYFAGVNKAADLDASADDKDQVPAIYGPKESQPYPMIGNVNLADAGINIERQFAELERDMPVLSMHRLRDGGNLTAPGVRAAYSDASDQLTEAQGIYDDGLMRAQKMAVSIGGFRGYKGFESFNLESYAKGDLEHFIKPRPIIADELSKSERLTALQGAGAPIWLVMEELGFDQLKIDEVVADAEEKARAAVRAFSQSTFGDDEDTTDDEETDTSSDTQAQNQDEETANPRPAAA